MSEMRPALSDRNFYFRRLFKMSYVDEVIDLVVKKNPAEPEFHQAVKEVLESLRPVIEANEEKYRKEAPS